VIEEPDLIERAVVFVDRRLGAGEFANGLCLDVSNMIPGAGWIFAGPGYRQWAAQDRVFMDASVVLSGRGYTMAQARFELPRIARSRLALGSQARWQDLPQVSFFGQGAGTLRSTRSEYRITSRDLVGYVTVRPRESLAIEGSIGWLSPSIGERAGWFEGDRPDTREVFPSDAVFAIPRQPTFVHGEASVTADSRDFHSHPTRGGLYRAAASNYAARTHVFSFRRYEAEASHFVLFAGGRIVVALHQWLVASDTNEGHVVPFYLQPSLGGHNSLRAYADYRFHDRHLVLVNAEGRVAVMAHVDAAVFLDAGNVAPVLADLNLDKRSYGAGLRLHTRRQTFARLDIAHGGEGWRLIFSFTDPLDLSRLRRRTAAVPFVP
jgi:hypothetical protein